MPLSRRKTSRTVSGLRTRFFPKSRIGQGLVSIGPWVDILLLLGAFLLLEGKLVLQPGIVVNLPVLPFRDGARPPAMMMVAMSMGGASGNTGREVIFFDDVRYLVEEPEDRGALRKALVEAARTRPDVGLTLLADRDVSHGTVMDLMGMAVTAGIPDVNLAAADEELEQAP